MNFPLLGHLTKGNTERSHRPDFINRDVGRLNRDGRNKSKQLLIALPDEEPAKKWIIH